MDFNAFESGAGCSIADQGFEYNMAYMLVATESFNSDGGMNALGSSCEESDEDTSLDPEDYAKNPSFFEDDSLNTNKHSSQKFPPEELESMLCEELVSNNKTQKNRPKEIAKEIRESKKYSELIKDYLKQNNIQGK